jgi:hypothetical protein
MQLSLVLNKNEKLFITLLVFNKRLIHNGGFHQQALDLHLDKFIIALLQLWLSIDRVTHNS